LNNNYNVLITDKARKKRGFLSLVRVFRAVRGKFFFLWLAPGPRQGLEGRVAAAQAAEPPESPVLCPPQAGKEGAQKSLFKTQTHYPVHGQGKNNTSRLGSNAGGACLAAQERVYFGAGETSMYAAYHLKADELNSDMLQTLKAAFQHREIVIMPKETYEEWEKERHNAAFTEKLRGRVKALDEGKGIIKSIAELEALANE
jgi:hypothetical protein